MPCVYNRKFRIQRTYLCNQVKISRVEYQAPRDVFCPKCAHAELRLYNHYSRKASFINEDGAKRVLIIRAKRYRCKHCLNLFREPIDGLLPKKRSSEQYRQTIAHEYKKNVNNKTIAREFRVSESTVERIIHEKFRQKIKEALSYPALLMIGIDEHSIHKGRKFATTIANWGNNRIYDIIEGKSNALIEQRLMSYKDRHKVKMVCMDLSSSYRGIVRRCFPNAKIVADRFHVIKMIQYLLWNFASRFRHP